MKKILILTLGLFVMLVGVTACGGGASEGDDQAKKDSLANDSIAKAMEAQRIQDSIQAHLDSLSMANDSLMNVEPKTVYIDNGSGKNNDGGNDDGGSTTEEPTTDKPANTNTGKGGRDREGVETGGTTGKDGRTRGGDDANKTEDGSKTSGKAGRTRGR